VIDLRELSYEELDSFLKDFNVSLYQTSNYAKTMEKQGFNIKILGLEQNGKIIGSTILLINKKAGFTYAYAPRGFVLDYSNTELTKLFVKQIKKYCKKQGIVAIKLNPLIVKSIDDVSVDGYDKIFNDLRKLKFYHFGYNENFESYKPRYESIIELDNPNLMFCKIKKEYRTKIRGAIDNGVEIHKGSYEDLKYLHLQTTKKYPRDLLYFQYLYYFFNQNSNIDLFYAKFDPKKLLTKFRKLYLKQEEICNSLNEYIKKDNSSKIVNLKIEADNLLGKYKNQLRNANVMVQNNPDGVVVASCLFIKNKDEVYMIMDGFDKKYKGYNAKHLLIWEAMQYYFARGYKKLNLGGITSGENPKYKGLNTFKLNFGSKKYEYIGDLELVCSNSKYFLLKNTLPYKK